jgi:ABC-type Zn uptake system ZnuABC Zn-binding protein ZnuA
MKTRTLFIVSISLVLAATAVITLVSRRTAAPDEAARKLKVVATLFPLYDMASAIGGSKAEVSLLLPREWSPILSSLNRATWRA